MVIVFSQRTQVEAVMLPADLIERIAANIKTSATAIQTIRRSIIE